MKNILIKYKLLILISGFVVILSSAILFLMLPFMEKIKITSNKTQEQLIDRQIEHSRISQLSQMEEDWNRTEEKREVLNVMLNSENQVRFIENIEAIAFQTGNKLDLKIGESVNAKDVQKIKKTENNSKDAKKGIMDELNYLNFLPVQISLAGDYGGLVNFIHMLENSKFYINVISIKSEKQVIEEIEESRDGVFDADEDNNKEDNKKENIISEINAIVYIKK